MVEILHANEERVIIRTKDGKILQVFDDVMKMKTREFDKNKRRNFWFHDIIKMSDLLQNIREPVDLILGWDVAKDGDFTTKFPKLPLLKDDGVTFKMSKQVTASG